MLLFDLSGYSTASGGGQMSLLAISVFAWIPAVALAMLGVYLLARTRYAWVAGSVAVLITLPRLLRYEIGFVLIGLADRLRDRGERC